MVGHPRQSPRTYSKISTRFYCFIRLDGLIPVGKMVSFKRLFGVLCTMIFNANRFRASISPTSCKQSGDGTKSRNLLGSPFCSPSALLRSERNYYFYNFSTSLSVSSGHNFTFSLGRTSFDFDGSGQLPIRQMVFPVCAFTSSCMFRYFVSNGRRVLSI
jgi:hypothetical protein